MNFQICIYIKLKELRPVLLKQYIPNQLGFPLAIKKITFVQM